jgi:hypothetical protein
MFYFRSDEQKLGNLEFYKEFPDSHKELYEVINIWC